MIQSPLEACLTKFEADTLSWCKDIGQITNILCRFEVVYGYTSVPLHEFDVPDATVLSGQDSDIGRLTSTLWEQNGVV